MSSTVARSLRATNQGVASYFHEVAVVARDKALDLAVVRLLKKVDSNGRKPLKTLRRFLVANKIDVAQQQSATELPLKQIASRAQLFTYLIECESGKWR